MRRALFELWQRDGLTQECPGGRGVEPVVEGVRRQLVPEPRHDHCKSPHGDHPRGYPTLTRRGDYRPEAGRPAAAIADEAESPSVDGNVNTSLPCKDGERPREARQPCHIRARTTGKSRDVSGYSKEPDHRTQHDHVQYAPKCRFQLTPRRSDGFRRRSVKPSASIRHRLVCRTRPLRGR